MKYVHGQKPRTSYKGVIVLWLAVIAIMVSGTAWVNAEINKRVTRVEVPTSYNGSILQASDQSSNILQPAGTAKLNFTDTTNPQATADASVLTTNSAISN